MTVDVGDAALVLVFTPDAVPVGLALLAPFAAVSVCAPAGVAPAGVVSGDVPVGPVVRPIVPVAPVGPLVVAAPEVPIVPDDGVDEPVPTRVFG